MQLWPKFGTQLRAELQVRHLPRGCASSVACCSTRGVALGTMGAGEGVPPFDRVLGHTGINISSTRGLYRNSSPWLTE